MWGSLLDFWALVFLVTYAGVDPVLDKCLSSRNVFTWVASLLWVPGAAADRTLADVRACISQGTGDIGSNPGPEICTSRGNLHAFKTSKVVITLLQGCSYVWPAGAWVFRVCLGQRQQIGVPTAEVRFVLATVGGLAFPVHFTAQPGVCSLHFGWSASAPPALHKLKGRLSWRAVAN